MDRLSREAEVIEGEMWWERMPRGLGVAAREVIILIGIGTRWKMSDGANMVVTIWSGQIFAGQSKLLLDRGHRRR